MIAEKWKPVTINTRYEISNLGRVRSPRGFISTRANKDGHVIVTLHNNGNRKTCYVHTLVLEAFVEPRPAGLQARHLDGVPSHNCVDNLKWGTQAENYGDRRIHGVDCAGERHGKARLKWSEVSEIRRRCAGGETQQSVAYDFRTSQARVSEIVNYKTWRSRCERTS